VRVVSQPFASLFDGVNYAVHSISFFELD